MCFGVRWISGTPCVSGRSLCVDLIAYLGHSAPNDNERVGDFNGRTHPSFSKFSNKAANEFLVRAMNEGNWISSQATPK